MKWKYTIILSLGLFSCNHETDKTQILQNRIDSLELQVTNTYKPGFGDFMSSIQIHHNKLWFAGQNENWELADFEVHEIREAIDDIKVYQKERKESKMIDLLAPALDSINYAIQQKDPELFKSSFILLTNTCNSCHKETDFGFNVVKIPDHPPFSNQDFKTHKGN